MEKRKYKERKLYTEMEAKEALEAMSTSGRKGLKLPRINVAFTPSNYEFVKTMARVRGQTMTGFINELLDKAREDNADIYALANKFKESMKGD